MILFLISLVIIISLHELSHLIAAKKCGCGVEVYSIGFGKPYLAKTFKNTEYRITPWLFGGYCRLKGELDDTKDKDAFINLPYLKKFAIAIAGCAINMITGLLSIFIGLLIKNYNLYYFGYLSFILGATNLLPIASCLDGGYIVFFPLYIKIYGKEKGLLMFAKSVKTSFKILIIINILSIPILFYFIITGGLLK